jgi:hypothetical protein
MVFVFVVAGMGWEDKEDAKEDRSAGPSSSPCPHRPRPQVMAARSSSSCPDDYNEDCDEGRDKEEVVRER